MFLKTVLPLSVSGIISGITMVFIPTISTFAISQLLSNGKIFLFGDSIQMKFEQGLYGVGSIMSLVMLVFVLVSNFIINRASRKSGLQHREVVMVKVKGIFEKAYLFVILAILYAPDTAHHRLLFLQQLQLPLSTKGSRSRRTSPSSLPRSRPRCGTRWATPSSSRRCLR